MGDHRVDSSVPCTMHLAATSTEGPESNEQNVTMATSTLAEMAVSLALEEARRGVFERANDNRGDRVDEYEKLAGMQGEAWCAMFVYWCYEQAAARLGVKNPMPRIFGAAQLEVWGAREKKM